MPLWFSTLAALFWSLLCLVLVYRAGRLELQADWKALEIHWPGLKSWLGMVILVLLVNLIVSMMAIWVSVRGSWASSSMKS